MAVTAKCGQFEEIYEVFLTLDCMQILGSKADAGLEVALRSEK